MRQGISEPLLSVVQEELTFRLFHNPDKPPSEVLWLVNQTRFSLSENKPKTGSGFKLVQNQFEKQNE